MAPSSRSSNAVGQHNRALNGPGYSRTVLDWSMTGTGSSGALHAGCTCRAALAARLQQSADYVFDVARQLVLISQGADEQS